MKRMKVPRGTKRAQRRAKAITLAQECGINHKFFGHFWRAGATVQAVEGVLAVQNGG